jgi:hypothetical protein
VIKSKSQQASQKQVAILDELHSSLAASVKALEGQVAKDAKEGEALCTKRCGGRLGARTHCRGPPQLN